MPDATDRPPPGQQQTSAIPPRHTVHSPPQPPKRPQEQPRPGIREKAQAAVKDLSGRAKAVKEILGLVCIPLAGIAAVQSKRQEDPNVVSPYALDVYTVEMHSDALATAVAELAESYPVMAATLDKIASLTPGASILGVGMLIFMQIAENHGRLSGTARTMSPFPIVERQEMAQMIASDATKMAAAATGGNGS